MKRKYIFIVFFILFVFGFFIFKENNILKNIPQDDLLALEVTSKTAIEFKQKYNLNFSGISLSGSKNVVKEIGPSFNCYSIKSRDEARMLILKCIDEFLFNINSFEKIQPFLSDIPFTEKNIEITIFFYKNANFDSTEDPDLCFVSLWNEKIHFHTKNPAPSHLYKTKEEETLDEARKIVQEQMKGA